jgi:myo-inositol 2-dehydrogenase / D-chiro-inositol 1-dehydrogenase
VDFTYPGDIHLSFSSTQFGDWGFDAGLRLHRAAGSANVVYSGPIRISGTQAWAWQDSANTSAGSGQFAANGSFSDNLAFADRDKERAFIESITSGVPHNQIAAGVDTALSCMLGRMAGYERREVTWEELLAHGETYQLEMNLDPFA